MANISCKRKPQNENELNIWKEKAGMQSITNPPCEWCFRFLFLTFINCTIVDQRRAACFSMLESPFAIDLSTFEMNEMAFIFPRINPIYKETAYRHIDLLYSLLFSMTVWIQGVDQACLPIEYAKSRMCYWKWTTWILLTQLERSKPCSWVNQAEMERLASL